MSLKNMIIGLGNCGSEIIKCITKRESLNDVKLYAIDSVSANVDASYVNRVHVSLMKSRVLEETVNVVLKCIRFMRKQITSLRCIRML